MKLSLRAIVAAACFAAQASPATAALDSARFSAAAKAYLAPYVVQHDFAGVVLVANPNGLAYQGAFGDADLAAHIPNRADTVFAVGSISKTFTAAAIELLAQRGRLHYDDALARFVPEYRYANQITIRQLLDHAAGVPDYYELPAFAAVREKDWDLTRIAGWLGTFPLDFTPGTQGRYSNAGYSLLALAVARASGQSFDRFVLENLIRPPGLAHTSVVPQQPGSAPNTAVGYDPGPPPQYLQTASYVAPGWLLGNGSMRSNAADLAKWLDVAAAGTVVNFKDLPYAYGWSKKIVGGSVLLDQDGRIPGFAARISIDEGSGVKVIVLSNVQSAAASIVAGDLRKAAEGANLVVPPIRPSYVPSAAELAADAGSYALPSLPLQVTSTGTGLLLTNRNDGMALALDPIAPGKFFFRPLFAYLTFKRNAGGTVGAIDWNGQIAIPRT